MSGVNPYIIFNGNAAQAISFYEKTLAAIVEYTMEYANAPFPVRDDWKQKILHASLVINGEKLMIADSSPEVKITQGDNIQIALNFETDQDIDKKFKALAEGGTVKMELQKSFWAKKFGMLVDQFGIHWMFNHGEASE